MANTSIKFFTGTYAQYAGLSSYDENALYFIDNGQLFKGATEYGNQVIVVDSVPANPVDGRVYVNSSDGSATYYDNGTPIIVVPEIIDTIGDDSLDTSLANVKAIKDFVAAEIAKIPAQTDYTVTLVDETAGENDLTKQTLKQGAIGEESEIGTIIVPKLVIDTSSTDTDAAATYKIIYGGTEVGKINIPKDLVVTQDGSEIIKVDDTHPVEGLTNGTYLKLAIQNNDKPVYINVADLCDVYTGKSETTGISVAVSETNEISAELVGKVVAEDNLADELASKINDMETALTWGTIA